MPSGLYMAPKSRYREYGARNRNACTCDIRVSVPYISHLAKHGPPNLPYISEIALNNVPFAPGTVPTTAPQRPAILFPTCSPPDARHPTGSCTHIPHQPPRTFPRIRQNLAIFVRKRGRGPPSTSRIRHNQPNPVRKTGSGGRTPLSPAPASPKSDRIWGFLSENEEEGRRRPASPKSDRNGANLSENGDVQQQTPTPSSASIPILKIGQERGKIV